jgi:hypothetical protein
MHKKRFQERPYDPISADLVRDATAGARRPAPAATGIALVATRPRAEPPSEATITKRFVLTRSEDTEVEAFLRVQRAARAKVPLGVLMRAALSVIMESEAALCAEAERQTFRLPSTHNRVALAEFEDQWRLCVRATGQFRSTQNEKTRTSI